MDLILQSKQAYRHVLMNGNYWSLVLKMTLLTVICDGYIAWSSTAGTDEFFEQEYEFYITCSKVVIALVGFLVTVMSVANIPFYASNKGVDCKRLLLGLLLAYSSRFFNLVALLWSPSPNTTASSASTTTTTTPSSGVMWAFVHLLFFVSSVRVHQVTQIPARTKSLSSWIQMLVGHAVFTCLLNLDQFLDKPNLTTS